jgi:hypothetical protein
VDACEGEELRLMVPPLDLHGALPSGEELKPVAGEVLGHRGAWVPPKGEGLASTHIRCRASASRIVQGASEQDRAGAGEQDRASAGEQDRAGRRRQPQCVLVTKNIRYVTIFGTTASEPLCTP